MIIVNQFKSVLYTKGCNEYVYRLSNGDSVLSKDSEILRCLEGDFLSDKVVVLKAFHELPGLLKVLFIPKSLQKFGQDKISGHNPVMQQGIVKEVGVRSTDPPNIINPDRGISDYHGSFSSY